MINTALRTFPTDSRSITSTLTWGMTPTKDKLGLKKIQEQTFHLSDASFWTIPKPSLLTAGRHWDKDRKTGTATSGGLKWKRGLITICWSPASDFPRSATWYLFPGCCRGPFILLTWSATSPSQPWPHTAGQPAPFSHNSMHYFARTSKTKLPQWQNNRNVFSHSLEALSPRSRCQQHCFYCSLSSWLVDDHLLSLSLYHLPTVLACTSLFFL